MNNARRAAPSKWLLYPMRNSILEFKIKINRTALCVRLTVDNWQ